MYESYKYFKYSTSQESLQVSIALQRGEHEQVRYGITDGMGNPTDVSREQFRRHSPRNSQHPNHRCTHVK